MIRTIDKLTFLGPSFIYFHVSYLPTNTTCFNKWTSCKYLVYYKDVGSVSEMLRYIDQ